MDICLLEYTQAGIGIGDDISLRSDEHKKRADILHIPINHRVGSREKG